MRTLSALVAACHSAACRPPTSGGTGGSSKGPGPGQLALPLGGRPKVIEASSSPHYQKRGDQRPVTEAQAAALVDGDTASRRIVAKGHTISDGQVVGVRPNINVLKTTGTIVLTMHNGTEAQLQRKTGLFTGEALAYKAAVTVKDANFSVSQEARRQIASGEKSKFPMSSVDGHYVEKPGADMFDGIELRFNPKREHLYVDPDGRPVKSASEATIAGSRVFARGKIEYFDESDVPAAKGGVPTSVQV